MPRLDRDELLARVDLPDLATEICGPPRGQGRSARWHCPNPDHPDRNPSMGIYTARTGQPRWKCHACGEGGTAIDLLMISTRVSAGDAIRALADRTATPITGRRDVPRRRLTVSTASTRYAASPPPIEPAPVTDPAIEQLVAHAAELLWQPIGEFARRHLHHRGLNDGVLRINRVGFDPGPHHLPRPPGLPHRSPGVVFPALDPTGKAIYYQLRSLSPRDADRRKYDQPTSELAPNPRIAAVRTPHQPTDHPARQMLIICEGFPDALTAAQAGHPALAVLGIGHADPHSAETLAHRILTQHPQPTYAICFDNDDRAQAAATRLADHLARGSATIAHLHPPTGIKDLNDWWRTDANTAAHQLTATTTLLHPTNTHTLDVHSPEPTPLHV